MKRILYISEHFEVGGGESSLLNLMIHFKNKLEFKPILLTPKYGKLNKIAEREGIKTYTFEFSKIKRAWLGFIPLFSLKAIYKFIKLIKKEEIDIIHVNNHGYGLTNSLLPSKICDTKLIWTCHGWWEHPYGLKMKILNLFLSKIFCVSDAVKSYVQFPDKKVNTTYLGIDLDKINRGKKGKIRTEIGVSKNDILIGVIGRYQDVKNQIFFVEVAHELLKEGYNFYFLLVGDALFDDKNNLYKQKVIELIQNSCFKDKFKMLNFREDIENIYADLDVLVIPSKFESFSMVTLEGIANGLKVVATDVGGPKEIIEDGKSGFVFESGNNLDLKQKILKALKSDTEESAKERAKEFNINKVANRYEELYYEVLE